MTESRRNLTAPLPAAGYTEGSGSRRLASRPMRNLSTQSIFGHAARLDWGAAVVAWERDGKRGYQFEDGRMRVFAADYYHLLERIDVSADRVRTLLSLLGLEAPTEAASLPAGAFEAPSLDEQIEYFLTSYPGGFTGDKWRGDHRGGTDRVLKRHRDPAVALARKELTVVHLTSCLDRRREDVAMQTLASVLGATDLVPAAHVQRLPELPPNRARAVLIGLYELLFGRTSLEVRVVQWVQALTRGTARKPTWGLATAPLALLAPDQHVCVNRASFLAQATSMAPRLRVTATPTGTDYGPLLAMSKSVRDRLEAVSSSPADLLDVHDFMVFTLRPDAWRRPVGNVTEP